MVSTTANKDGTGDKHDATQVGDPQNIAVEDKTRGINAFFLIIID